MDTVRGSCLCGDVAWEAAAPFELMHHCHCSICRKVHGAAFETAVGAPAEGFCWLRGEGQCARFEASPGSERTFCDRCGSCLPGDPVNGLIEGMPRLLQDGCHGAAAIQDQGDTGLATGTACWGVR